MEGGYVAGKKEGSWKEYYEDGKLKAVYSCKNGELNGKQTAYDNSGKVVEERVYENGSVKQ